MNPMDLAGIMSPEQAAAWRATKANQAPNVQPVIGPSYSTPFPGDNPSGMEGNYSQDPKAIQDAIARNANLRGITVEEAQAEYDAENPNKRFGGSHEVDDELELSPKELARLKKMGYKFDYI
jgi:hypothetical protein